MPDPVDPTPVKVKKRGGKFVVVDRNDKTLRDSGEFDDADAAAKVAAQVNGAWSGAKSGRKAKGAPAITREARVGARADRISVLLGTGELQESVMEVAAPRLRLTFDPRLHPRDRIGEFSQVLSKLQQAGHGSTLDLPHGIQMRNRLGRLELRSPYASGPVRMHTPMAAAGVGLSHVDRGEIEHGASLEALHFHRLDELTQARTAAMRAGSLGDQLHVEEEMRSVRKERKIGGPLTNRHGRRHASIDAYQATHAGGSTKNIADVMGHDIEHHLPAPMADADSQRPELAMGSLELRTGYGTYAMKPNPRAAGIYDLHRDDTRMGVIGDRVTAEHTLGALHDEALERHQLQRIDQRRQVIEDELKLTRRPTGNLASTA